MPSVSSLLQANPAVVKTLQAFVDTLLGAAEEIGKDAALQALPTPMRLIAEALSPVLTAGEKELQTAIDAEFAKLLMAPIPATAAPSSLVMHIATAAQQAVSNATDASSTTSNP